MAIIARYAGTKFPLRRDNLEGMKSTSAAQERAWSEQSVPPLEQVRDDVWALGLGMPGGHIPFSLTYLLRDSAGGIHAVDAGWDSDENWDAFTAALNELASPGTVESLIVTHLHPDHLGMAERLRRETGARIILHEVEQSALAAGAARAWTADSVNRRLNHWGVPVDARFGLENFTNVAPEPNTTHADLTVIDGQHLDIPGFDLTAMWTPGHTSGHLSLRDDDRHLMYTGDHLLPTMYPGLGLGNASETNPIADYLDSLDAISTYPDYEVLPGHGYRFTGLAARAEKTAGHHLRRAREVAAVLAEGGDPSVWDIAARLTWTAGWENLKGFMVMSALAQTAMHRDFVLSPAAVARL